jgi:hypothetical protein
MSGAEPPGGLIPRELVERGSTTELTP